MALISNLAAGSHTHRIAILGGVQQAAAISLLLNTKDGKENNGKVYLGRIH